MRLQNELTHDKIDGNLSESIWRSFTISLLNNDDDSIEVLNKMDYITSIIKGVENDEGASLSVKIHIEDGDLDGFLNSDRNGGALDWELTGDFTYHKENDYILAFYTPDED